MKKKVYRKCVYELRHPDTDVPVYVGVTVEPYYRFHEHKAPSTLKSQKHSKLHLWIKALIKEGKLPVMKIVKDLPMSFTRKQMIEAERIHMTNVMKTHKLFNLFLGANHTEKTKAWVVKGNKNRVISSDMKKKISEANSKYSFEYKGQKVIGLEALSKIIGMPISTIHYNLSRNKTISGVKLA